LEKFSINIMGCYFSPILSLFLRLLSPKGPKKSLKNLLNSPSLKAFFPQVFCIKMKIVKEKIEWKKMNKKQHDSTLEKTKLQICISVF